MRNELEAHRRIVLVRTAVLFLLYGDQPCSVQNLENESLTGVGFIIIRVGVICRNCVGRMLTVWVGLNIRIRVGCIIDSRDGCILGTWVGCIFKIWVACILKTRDGIMVLANAMTALVTGLKLSSLTTRDDRSRSSGGE